MIVAPRVANFGAIIAIMGALFAIDIALADLERSETARDARQYYDEGERLLKQGQIAVSVDAFQRAHTLDRTNRDYELGLIAALMGAGRNDEARTMLGVTLQQDPGNGYANLLMARLLTNTRDFEQAQSYYHRAIYGSWPSNSRARRAEVRLELIKLLAQRNQPGDLLSELLPLEGEADDDPAVRKQIAQYFLVANSPSRAADLFRVLIRANSRDSDLYKGLGEAELEMGNYQLSLAAFASASKLEPGDAGIRRNLELTREVASLDPTLRWLSSNEKYTRSVRVLQLARDSLQKCGVDQSAKSLVDQAGTLLAVKQPNRTTNEDAESRLSLAEQLCSMRPAKCPVTAEFAPVQLIIEKLKRMK